MARVLELWRYPVKSMVGERVNELEVFERGIPGDRAWAVRDEVRGAIVGAKKIAGLMKLSAAYAATPQGFESTPATITFEDGSTVSTTHKDANDRPSRALGHRVSLWPLVPETEPAHYRRAAPDNPDLEQEFRTTFARNADEPLPDFTVFPPELFEYESPIGTYFDAFPIMLMTETSLATMQARHPDSRFDVRRFRPNFLLGEVETADPLPELGWAGRRARIGEAILRFTVRCPRCVMTTREFHDLPKDPKIMRAMVTETGGDLGIYASVEKPGKIRRGDVFELLD